MKDFNFLSLLFLFCIGYANVSAQNKNDYIWMLGFPPNKIESHFGGISLDYNKDVIVPQIFDTQCYSDGVAVISNDEGELKLYSDGCRIFNSLNQIIDRGDSLGYGLVFNNYCNDLGYPGTQNKLLLPDPQDSTEFYLFHFKINDNFASSVLLYTKITINSSEPEGKVISKNNEILNTGNCSIVSAVKHGNGRDWWLIAPEANTNRFFKLLLDISGIHVIDTQSIGSGWGPNNHSCQTVFTPDGTKFIRFNPWKGLDIFDFDRCSGELSNPIESGPLTEPVLGAGGVGVSLNSQFLYVSNLYKLYQFDLKASDILQSEILIDTFDHYINPFQTNFYQMNLAPDGRLYVFSSNGVKSIHVINYPDRHDKACNFVQHQIESPVYLGIGAPNIPYFRLGPLDGSVCDTLGINNLLIAYFRYDTDSNDLLKVNYRNLSYYNPKDFHWDFGNGLSSEEKDPEGVEYDSFGNYTVCLTAVNKYGSDTFCRSINLIESSVPEVRPSNNSYFKIYPNPVSSNLNVVAKDLNSPCKIQFFSLLGEPILSQTLFNNNNSVNLSNIPQGVYMYIIYSKNQIIQLDRIIKI